MVNMDSVVTYIRRTKGKEGSDSEDASWLTPEIVKKTFMLSMWLENSKFDSAELEAVHTLADKAQVILDPRSLIVWTRNMQQL